MHCHMYIFDGDSGVFVHCHMCSLLLFLLRLALGIPRVHHNGHSNHEAGHSNHNTNALWKRIGQGMRWCWTQQSRLDKPLGMSLLPAVPH